MEQPIRLSEHFTSDEFACPCCNTFQVDTALIKALEQLRTLCGQPLHITSGYRCQKHNKAVGGVQSSLHLLGTAADVAIPRSHSLKLFYQRVENVNHFANGGVGLYPKEGFIHVDVRGRRARWARINGKYTNIEEALK